MQRNGVTETHSVDVDVVTSIGELEQEETYKYVGVSEADGIPQ